MNTNICEIITLVDGMHLKGKSKDGLVIDMDSRPAGVIPKGPAPMELVLQAIGGCSGMDIIFILKKRKRELEQFEIRIEGTKRDEHPKIFEEINIVYRAKGEGITMKELERAASLSMEKYCSVSAMLRNSVKINWKCELIED
ncbi:OsmC family protein [bacterium]|nr:OsmC family protein [bacterium]